MVHNEGKVKDFINRAIDTVKYYTGEKDSKYNYTNNPTKDELKNNPLGQLFSKRFKSNKQLINYYKERVENSAKVDRKNGMIRYQLNVSNVPNNKAFKDAIKPGGTLYKYVTDYKDKIATMELPIEGGRVSLKAQKKDEKNMKKDSKDTTNKESMMTPVQVPEDQRSLQCDSEGHLILKNSKEKVDESLTESYYDFDEDGSIDNYYKFIKSKYIIDSDGWRTEYSMYYDTSENKYVFIYGDSDLYNPTNTDPDWEEENEDAANEWFDSYGEDEDDLDWNEDEELSDEEVQSDLDAASKEWGTDKDDEADLESLELKEGPSRLEIMKTHRAQYNKLQKKIDTMPDGLDKDIAIELGLKWIKGRDWMGGISDSDANKALSKLAKKYGISEEEIDDKFDKDYVMNAVEYESLELNIKDSLEEGWGVRERDRVANKIRKDLGYEIRDIIDKSGLVRDRFNVEYRNPKEIYLKYDVYDKDSYGKDRAADRLLSSYRSVLYNFHKKELGDKSYWENDFGSVYNLDHGEYVGVNIAKFVPIVRKYYRERNKNDLSVEGLKLKDSEEDKPKKLYHCDDCGYEVELTDDEYDGMCPHCHEHHGFYAYEDEDVNEQILNETPGLTLSTPKVTYKDQDDYEGRLEIEINGKKYMYRCNMGTDATAREMADKVAKMQKFSDGKALAYLKKNMHLVTESVKVGDKVKVDTNFRGVNPKIKEVEITKVESGLATKDDPNPSKVLTVKGKDGAEFKVDESQIVKESILKEDKSINWVEIPDRDLYIWKSDLEVDSTYDSVRAGSVALIKSHKVPAFVVKGSPDRGYEVTIPLHNWKRRSIAIKDTPEEAFAAAEKYRQSHIDDYGRIDEATRSSVADKTARELENKLESKFYDIAINDPEWAYEDQDMVDEYMMPRIEVHVDPKDRGRLIATVAAEYSGYDAQYGMDDELNKVICIYDTGSYFEQVEPGISEAIVYVDDRAGKIVDTEVPLRGQDYAYEGLQLKTEAHYGGAFDIADDQYFTRDDLDMFAEELLDNLKIFTSDDINYDIGDIDIQNGNELFVEVDAEGNSFFGKVKIDMRKIKTPASLTVKYVPEILIQIMKQIDEYNKEGFAEITLTPTAKKMIGESVEVNEGLQLKTEANVIYDNPNSKEAKLVKMEQNLHIYIHQKMWKDALNIAEYIVEILKDLISDNVKTESLGPTSDGWSDKVRLIVGEVFDDCYDTQYEIDSAYRGYHTNAHTAGELADYLYGLADRLTSAAEDLQSQEEELNESKKLDEKKVSFKDVHICQGCGKPLSQCTCGIKEEDLKEGVIYQGQELVSKSGHKIKILSIEPFVSDYDGNASLKIKYEYELTDGTKGSSECNNWDLFHMLNEDLNESATQVSNVGQHKTSSIDLIEDEKEDKEEEDKE